MTEAIEKALSGLEKAAILLVLLGEEAATAVYRNLSEEDLRTLTQQIASLQNVPPEVADQFEATIVWMADEPMLPGRSYWLKLGTQLASVQVQQPKYEINVNTLEQICYSAAGGRERNQN